MFVNSEAFFPIIFNHDATLMLSYFSIRAVYLFHSSPIVSVTENFLITFEISPDFHLGNFMLPCFDHVISIFSPAHVCARNISAVGVVYCYRA